MGAAIADVADASEARHVDFLYVDANEDTASGGHVALRLGDQTYHFGYHRPGLLFLDREDSDHFERVYTGLENRTIESRRIAVSAETFELLRAGFNERYLTETAEREAIDSIVADRELVERWSSGSPEVDVRAAGYFADREKSVADPPLARLRAAVRARYGNAYAEERIEAATRAIRRLAETPIASGSHVGWHVGWHVDVDYGVAARAADLASEIEAFRVLDAASLLRTGALVPPAASEPDLDARERRSLASYAGRLERELVDLAGSRRPDVGFALLLGMARFLALEESLRTGRLLVLDAYPLPPDVRTLSREEVEAQGGRLDELGASTRSDLERSRVAFSLAEDPREPDWGALEEAANRHREVASAIGSDRPIRIRSERLLPARPARRSLPGEGRIEPSIASAAISRLEREETTRREKLVATYDYDLLTRNCVSEIFVEIDRALEKKAEPDLSSEAREAAVERLAVEHLGGHVPPNRGFEFIPFVAADAVDEELRVDGVEVSYSYRRARVAERTESEGFVAALRESNVLTSTVYRRNVEDSAFLFFTDDAFFARPLFGAVNLVVGVGASAFGLALLPLDRGDTAWAGLRGILWSVPELAFWNVRKGSFFAVPEPEANARPRPESAAADRDRIGSPFS